MTDSEPRHSVNPILLYVLYFDDFSLARACSIVSEYTWKDEVSWSFIPLLVPTSPIFENEPLAVRRKLLSKTDRWFSRRYVGFISWRIFEKISESTFINAMYVLRDGLDMGPGSLRQFPHVVAFYGLGVEPYGLGLGAINFSTTWDRVLPSVDIRLVGRPYRAWLCNYWAASPRELWQFAQVLDRAIEAFTNDGVALMPTNYDRVPTETMRKAGMTAYPLMPFLLERLAPSYFQLVSNATLWQTTNAWNKPIKW